MIPKLAPLALIPALLTLVLVPASAQDLLYTIPGYSPGDYFGFDVAGGGDANGDGVPDALAGTYRGPAMAGHLKVVSGADGSVLHAITGAPNQQLARHVGFIGDVNLDGFDDFVAVGNAIRAYSGRTGLELYVVSPGAGAVEGIADFDGDQIPDYMTGDTLRSGPTGDVIRQLMGNATLAGDLDMNGRPEYLMVFTDRLEARSMTDDMLHFTVRGYFAYAAGAGDVNSDGHDDVLAFKVEDNAYLLQVFSGVDGGMIRQHEVGFALDEVQSLAAAGDVDGDGAGDYLFQDLVFSGRTGCLLMDYTSNLAFVVAGVGDMNGDGYDEVIVGSPVGVAGGHAYIYSYNGPLGPSYCMSQSTSSGQPSLISARGTTSIVANDLVLMASDVPAGQTGVFYYGPAQTQVVFGNGFRCVDGGGASVGRLPVVYSDSNGCFEHALDYANAPTATTQITAGSTWHFQAWFRDPQAGGASFNLSDGTSLSFHL